MKKKPEQGEITYQCYSQYPNGTVVASTHTVKITGMRVEVMPDMNDDGTVDNTDAQLLAAADKDLGAVYVAESNAFHRVDFNAYGGVTGMVYKVTLKGGADIFALYADTNAAATVTSSTDGSSFEFPLLDNSAKAVTNFWLECRQPGTGEVSYAYLSRTSSGDTFISSNSVRVTASKLIAEPITLFPGNPDGLTPNGTAGYAISVIPTSLASIITWSNGNNRLTFQGASTGVTNVTVTAGSTLGDTKLTASIKGLVAAKPPEFNVNVMALSNVTVSVIIVTNSTGGGFTARQARNMVTAANQSLRRGGVRLVVGSITYTNNPAWFDMADSEATWPELGAVPNPGDGLKVFFLNTIDGGETLGFNVLNRCMAISMGAITGVTLAHEVGHECGLDDIYPYTHNGVSIIARVTGLVASDRMDLRDWGAGCYSDTLTQADLIWRLLMCGYGDVNASYIPHGQVYGIPGYGDNVPKMIGVGLDGMSQNLRHNDL